MWGGLGNQVQNITVECQTLVDSGVVASKLADSVLQADSVERESLKRRQIIPV